MEPSPRSWSGPRPRWRARGPDGLGDRVRKKTIWKRAERRWLSPAYAEAQIVCMDQIRVRDVEPIQPFKTIGALDEAVAESSVQGGQDAAGTRSARNRPWTWSARCNSGLAGKSIC